MCIKRLNYKKLVARGVESYLHANMFMDTLHKTRVLYLDPETGELFTRVINGRWNLEQVSKDYGKFELVATNPKCSFCNQGAVTCWRQGDVKVDSRYPNKLVYLKAKAQIIAKTIYACDEHRLIKI